MTNLSSRRWRRRARGRKTEVIERGLRALLEREARLRLKALFGKGPSIANVRRRR